MRLKDSQGVIRLMRLATPGTMAYAAVFPLVQVGLIAESTGGWGGGYADGAWALLATAAYLPLHLRHVKFAAEGSRAPGGGWTLAAMTVVVLVAALPLGDLWLPSFHAVAVSALLVLRPRSSLLVVAAVVTAQVPLALLMDSWVPAAPSYYAVTVLWRSAAVFVPIWLVGAVRGLQQARQALAEDAVVRERMRIDAELRDTLSGGLRSIVHRGAQAAELVDRDRRRLAQELDALVGDARRTLGQARQMVNGYQRRSLSAEIETAVTLLGAAGIEARVVLPNGEMPDVADDDVRSQLRGDIARLLRRDSTRSCVLTVTCPTGHVQVEVSTA